MNPPDLELLNQAAALLLAADPARRETFARAREIVLFSAQTLPVKDREISRALSLIDSVANGTTPTPADTLVEAAAILEAIYEEGEKTGAPGRGECAEEPAPMPAVVESSQRPRLDSLAPDFANEALEHLASAEAALLPLESNPGELQHLNTVFRAFHTIKSTSGFLGFHGIHDLSHRAEELLDRARKGEILLEGGYADLTLGCCDALRNMVSAVAEGRPPAPPDKLPELVAHLEAAAHARPTPMNPVAQRGHDAPPGARRATRDASTRVSTERLDAVVNLIGELVIAHSMTAQDPELRGGRLTRLAENVALTDKILQRLQDLAMSLRLVPLRATFQKMARVARDLARKSGKQVEFVAEGEETELDRAMVQELGDPLVHMLRNAIDHGIEPPSERCAQGKPARGRVSLRAYHSAGRVVVEISDDGRGLDRPAILKAALQRGIIDRDANPSDAELWGLIASPGLSTARTITEVSGRGVGLDVVQQRLQALRGRLDVQSQPGRGTTFRLSLPLTTAIMDTMLLRIGAERFLLPTASIVRSFRPKPGAIVHLPGRGEVTRLREDVLRVVRLGQVLGIPGYERDAASAILVVVETDRGHCALLADELLGQSQVVVKPLDCDLANQPGLSGAAILGDGKVGLILDAASLLCLADEHHSIHAGPSDPTPAPSATRTAADPPQNHPA